ncbi:MAG TPA: hypothetical protein PK014_08995 [Thermoanaerobaculia bacterium]|nr:hypothetical protein [Thermoanaerobaculia bacterium]HUM30321.1 hypothetical protein [Thermoanaerobaculia bacterium]HXK68528.1 hypothetical protein [Thermoanaerobaculia bacterium]
MLTRVSILVGHFGSGKSEIGINLALKENEIENDVYFVDLDIVKPFFRSRMVRNFLVSTGVSMIIPSGERVYADLPIVMPEIRGVLQNGSSRVVMDVAGDADGCRVLSSFHDVLNNLDLELLMVVNHSRPRTSDIDGNLAMIQSIEATSRLKVTGIIANTHLMDETTPDVVLNGFHITRKFAELAGLPIQWVVAKEEIVRQLDPSSFSCPILPIRTFIRPPFGAQVKGFIRPSVVA